MGHPDGYPGADPTPRVQGIGQPLGSHFRCADVDSFQLCDSEPKEAPKPCSKPSGREVIAGQKASEGQS